MSGKSMTLSRTDWKSTVSTIFPQIHDAQAAALPGAMVSSLLLSFPFHSLRFSLRRTLSGFGECTFSGDYDGAQLVRSGSCPNQGGFMGRPALSTLQ